GVALDGAAATERALQRLQPRFQLRWTQTELLDHGDFLAATALSLHPHGRSRRTLRLERRLRLRTAREIAQLVLERAERVVEGLLLVHPSESMPGGGEEAVRIVQMREGAEEAAAHQLRGHVRLQAVQLRMRLLQRERDVLVLFPPQRAGRVHQPPARLHAAQRRLEDLPLPGGKA